MNKFEQLIEYVINDEEQKARELFHDIVVAKSREIYENLMQEEDLDEAKHEEEELDEAADEEELDEAEEMDEGAMGGDASDDLIDEIEADEESDMSMEAEEGDDDMGGDDMGGDDMGGDDMGGGDEPATKGDIMDLEDKLDQLMADFESLMNDAEDGELDGDGDGFGGDEGGDAIEMDDTEEMMPEMGSMPMAEAVTLKAAPKPVTSEEGGINKKSTVAANSGAAGMAAKPVHATGTEAKGRPAPGTKDLISDFQNKAGAGMKDMTAATKPHLAQATGVNTKSPLPGGRKG
jgi:hypothetical protein